MLEGDELSWQKYAGVQKFMKKVYYAICMDDEANPCMPHAR
jgi:hypothetical protein